MTNKIICTFDFVNGMKFPVGKEREGIWNYLDEEFNTYKTYCVSLNIGSCTQFLAVEYYAKKYNYELVAFIPDENNPEKLIKVEGEDLYKASYYLNKEFIHLYNEFELFECEKDKSE